MMMMMMMKASFLGSQINCWLTGADWRWQFLPVSSLAVVTDRPHCCCSLLRVPRMDSHHGNHDTALLMVAMMHLVLSANEPMRRLMVKLSTNRRL